MDIPEHFVSFPGGGYTVSGLVRASDWARIVSGAECWVPVFEAQSADHEGRTMDFGEITVLFRDGEVAETGPDTSARP